jgi:uncharacterized membrane protein YjgN (DUF898 family)
MSVNPSTEGAAITAPRLPARPMPFRFTGSGNEYFRIWIVNILLTLLTLGIYSAWAKVRRNRYFYGHTRLGEAAFEYTAEPLAILKGRAIAFVLFFGYALLGNVWPPAQAVFGLLFLGLLPWLVVRALTFRARHSAFRNIRFDFNGSYRDAIMAYVGFPLLSVLTLGFLYPYAMHRQKQFIVTKSAFGTANFSFQARVGEFYKIFLVTLGIVVAAGALLAVAMAAAPRTVWLAGLLAAPFYLFLFAYFNSRMGNIVYNGARLEMHSFRSNLKPLELFLIYLTNILGVVVTLGLFIPWARVRLARYRAERLTLLAVGDLSHFVASEQKRVSSTGEEVGEMFDIDIGL